MTDAQADQLDRLKSTLAALPVVDYLGGSDQSKGLCVTSCSVVPQVWLDLEADGHVEVIYSKTKVTAWVRPWVRPT